MMPLTVNAIPPSGGKTPWPFEVTTRHAALFCEGTTRLAAPDHFFAIGVESVVDDPLGRIEIMIVFVAEMAEALRNSVQAGAFGLMPKRVVGVGAVDDLPEQHQRRVAVKLVLLDDRLERAFLAVM